MAVRYSYRIKITSPWSGPRNFFAGEAVEAIGAPPVVFFPLLASVDLQIVNTINPKARSSAAIPLLNKPVSGKLLSQHVLDDSLDEKLIDILRVFEGSAAEELVLRGVIRKVDLSEKIVTLEVVDRRRDLNVPIGDLVRLSVWPRAKPEDVGKVIPVPFGNVKDMAYPVVADNPISRIAVAIDSATSDLIELEDDSRFPASGRVRIGRELIDYSGKVNKNLTGLTRGVSSTEAASHGQGEAIASVQALQIAVDDSARPSNVVAANVIGENREKIPLPLPTMLVVNGVRVAQYDETPQYDKPIGDLACARVKLDTDAGSTDPSIDAKTFAEDAEGFTRDGFSFIGFAPATGAKARRDAAVRDLGIIRKVILEVQHSGNKSVAISGLDSAIGPGGVPVVPGFADVIYNGTTIGQLTDPSTVSDDLVELGCFDPAFTPPAAGQPPPGPVLIVDKAVEFTAAGVIDRAGFANSLFTDADLANLVDANDATFAQFGAGLDQGDEINMLGLIAPPGVPLNATVTRIKFDFIHGNNPNDSGLGQLQVRGAFPATPLIASGPAFAGGGPGLINRRMDTAGAAPGDAALAAWLGAGRPLSDVIANRWLVLLNAASAFTARTCRLRLDYNFVAGPGEGENPITNHFDISALVSGWADMRTKVSEVVATGPANVAFRLYVLGLRVIYTPTEKRFAESMLLDVDADIQGTAATVCDELWRSVASNPAPTIDAAAVATATARLAASGFTNAGLTGRVGNVGVFDAVVSIASQSRLRAFFPADSVLRLVYTEDLADLPAIGPDTITKALLMAEPVAMGIDADQELIRLIRYKFDRTDLNDFVGSEEIAGGSVGKKTINVDLPFIRDSAQALKVITSLIERGSTRFHRFRLVVDLNKRNIALLDLLRLSFVWATFPRFEVERIVDLTRSHKIRLEGRTL